MYSVFVCLTPEDPGLDKSKVNKLNIAMTDNRDFSESCLIAPYFKDKSS